MIFPPRLIITSYFDRNWGHDLASINWIYYAIFLTYYILEPTVWGAIPFVASRSFLSSDSRRLRWGQVAALVLIAVFLSFDFGRGDALGQESFEKCPRFDNQDSVMLERTGDIGICAIANFS